MTATLERRPRELDPASSTNPASVIIVDDPTWPYARSLSKDKWHNEFKGDDVSIGFVANNNEPSAQTGKLSLFFDGTALKAKLPDGSVAILTQLGVGLYQAHDPTLDAFAQAASGPDLLAYFSGVDQVSSTPFTAFGRSLIDDADAAAARATLALGSAATRNVPALGDAAAGEIVLGSDSRLGGTSDPTLAALAALTVSAADKMIYSTGVETFGLATLTAFARTLLDDADAATMRATLGLGTGATKNTPVSGNAATNELVLGSDTRLAGGSFQAADATLTGLANLITAADQIIYATGVDAFAMASISAFMRGALADVSAAAHRITLGLGTAATVNTGTGTTNAILGNDARLSDARPSTWGAIGGTLGTQTDLNTALSGKQTNNANLTAISGLTTAADLVTYWTGAGSAATTGLTAFGRSLVAAAAASNARTILGLAGAALLNIGTTTGTAAAGDDARFTDSRPLLSGSTVPNHFATEQTARTTTPQTIAVGDSGDIVPMNVASGVLNLVAYSGSFKGFGGEYYAVQAFDVKNTGGTVLMSIAAGESVMINARNSVFKVSKLTAATGS